MTPQEAIKVLRFFVDSSKPYDPVFMPTIHKVIEALNTLISELEKQPQYPTKEMFQFAMWLTGHDLDTILQMYQDFNKWKESNNKNK